MNAIELLCILAWIFVIGLIFVRPKQVWQEPAMIVTEMCDKWDLPDTGVLF